MKNNNVNIKDIIKRTPLVVGEKWYLINFEWFDKWSKNMLGLGPIDNSNLLVAGTDFIKPGLIETTHFEVVPEKLGNVIYIVDGVQDVIPCQSKLIILSYPNPNIYHRHTKECTYRMWMPIWKRVTYRLMITDHHNMINYLKVRDLDNPSYSKIGKAFFKQICLNMLSQSSFEYHSLPKNSPFITEVPNSIQERDLESLHYYHKVNK
ncbi:hypothetical protein DFA_01472 [Cavenderia fasciculata]|uniref:DUSP domain-containing protein n=1 Tax=Cavenderia fasciculata TaxID=261658 RepID=F4PT10_CACFS|nr:uncharacterized protein DFA_01472 [Cavenderia fasciculata]EGG21586.1 hypothetical protein DFA_01472 [Cavenderia fasciculata]|eukprot:XP_004359436.1 hypothetical protein DFA_01472 [Cavenderia fasciculata]